MVEGVVPKRRAKPTRRRQVAWATTATSPPGKDANQGWPINFKPYKARVANGRFVSAEDDTEDTEDAEDAEEGPRLLLVRHAQSVSNARGDWKKQQNK